LSSRDSRTTLASGKIAKAWKDADLDLDPGRHYFDEVLTIRVSGTVEKQADQLVAPTTSSRFNHGCPG